MAFRNMTSSFLTVWRSPVGLVWLVHDRAVVYLWQQPYAARKTRLGDHFGKACQTRMGIITQEVDLERARCLGFAKDCIAWMCAVNILMYVYMQADSSSRSLVAGRQLCQWSAFREAQGDLRDQSCYSYY